MFLYCTGGSLVAILLGTELGLLPADPEHCAPDLHQWLHLHLVGLAIVPVSEARRLLLDAARTGATGEPQEGARRVRCPDATTGHELERRRGSEAETADPAGRAAAGGRADRV